VLQPERPLDPAAEPERVAEQLERFAAAGATAVNARFVHHSPAHYVEQLEALVAVQADV
jgi:alkanesulfonate monooxygenase SsuD/methylene tetrahydromethanopterin reductase-like flavin-dependent oxidoreductase (luciferase family)